MTLLRDMDEGSPQHIWSFTHGRSDAELLAAGRTL
jgi:hypothetical protein